MYQKHKNGEITAIQIFVLLINLIIGTGILGITRVVSEVSKQDAWISVLINGIFLSLMMVIIVYTISKFPSYNFLQYTSLLLSKPLGYIITLLFAIYGVVVTGIVIRFLSEMIYTWLLPETPIIVINFIIVITIMYMTRNGITTLARFNETISFLLIPFALLIFVGLPEADFINLRPIGGTGIVTILKGAMPSFFAFSGYESILVYYPYISDKKSPVMKYSVLAILIVTVFYTATVMSQIALYGSDEVAHVLYPSINYLTAVNFPLVERTEIFFTIFWIFTVLATIGIQYLAAGLLLQNIFKTKKINTFIYSLSPVIFIIPYLIPNTVSVTKFGDMVSRLNIFFGIFLPIILFVIYFVRRRAYNNEKSK